MKNRATFGKALLIGYVPILEKRPTLQLPSNIHHKNSSGKYWDALAYEILFIPGNSYVKVVCPNLNTCSKEKV